MPYLTPDTPPSDTICRTITIPNDINWIAIVNGALSELFKAYNFEKFGSLTPEETAELFYSMWSDYHESECMDFPIGMIAPFTIPNGTVPAKWLWANGAIISRTTYAKLFAVIGTQYGAGDGSTTFKIPDLRGTFIQGITIQTSAQMGAQGGAAQKTISVANLPAHHHAQRMRNGNNMLLAGGATNRVSVTSTTEFNLTTPIDTADTGGGTPIDVMNPYTDLSYGIYAGI